MSDYKELEEAVIKTLCWFDIFDYPLKRDEVFDYLIIDKKTDYDNFLSCIESSDYLKKNTKNKEGFICLKERDIDELIRYRTEKEKLSDAKIKKAFRFIKFFRFIPYIKFISVCNDLGYRNANYNSDIDLFIITDKGKIWTVRFFVVGILKVLNLRPKFDFKNSKSYKRKDRIDANFFITTDAMDMESLSINFFDIYLFYWVNQMMVAYDRGRYYDEFLNKNLWTENFLSNIRANKAKKEHLGSGNVILRFIARFLFSFVSFEALYSYIQKKIIYKNIRHLKNTEGVIISDNMIKLHFREKRREYYEIWVSKTKQYGVTAHNTGYK